MIVDSYGGYLRQNWSRSWISAPGEWRSAEGKWRWRGQGAGLKWEMSLLSAVGESVEVLRSAILRLCLSGMRVTSG